MPALRADDDSVLERPALPPASTRAYGIDPAQVYDVRLPAAGAAPLGGTVLVVHGGFWRAAYDRSHAGPMAQALADAGLHVAVGEYRRAGMPGGGVPGTLDDITALVAAVAQNPDLPDPLVLLGHSAGGHLVAWAANQSWAAGLGGVVVLAGCVDLGATDRLHLGADAAHDLIGDPAVAPEAWEAADPMTSLPPRVPVRLVHGRDDEEVPLEVTDVYLAEARATGGNVTLEVVESAGHYSLIDPEHPAFAATLTAVRSLLPAG